MHALLLVMACVKVEDVPIDSVSIPTPPDAPTLSFVDAAGATGLTPCAGVYGIALGDYNLDRQVDLSVSCGEVEPLRLFRNDSGRFTDVSADVSASFDANFNDRRVPAFGPSIEDGQASLFVPTGGGNGQGTGYDQLFTLVDGAWTDLGSDLEVQDPAGGGRFGVWVDPDGDGDEDLFVGHRVYPGVPERDHHVLWKNGDWSDAGAEWGLSNTLTSAGSALSADWDGDGFEELLLTPRCVGTAVDCSDDPMGEATWLRGTGVGYEPQSCAALGEAATAAAAELNGDGLLDLAVGRIGAPALLLFNPGDGTGPCDWTGEALAEESANATALVAGDFDNDGAVDLFLAVLNPDGVTPPLWLRGDGQGGFTTLSDTGPLLWPRNGRVLAAPLDMDGDGWLDLVVAAEGITDSASLHLLRNELGDRGLESNAYELWLNGGRRSTLGAKVQINGESAWSLSGGSWRTSAAQMLHIGVGALEEATIEVTWPDGTVHTHDAVAPGCYRLGADDASIEPC